MSKKVPGVLTKTKISLFSKLKNKLKEKNGSLVLDTALMLPVILFVCYFMISAALTVQHEVIMRYALDQTCKELSLLIPVSEALIEGIQSEEIEDFFAQISIDHQELKNSMSDLAASVFLQNYLQDSIERWSNDIAMKLRVRIPLDERQIIISSLSDHALELKLHYHIYTAWSQKEKSIVTYLPLWTKFDYSYQAGSEDEENKKDDNIWSEHNFTRGKYFREKYNANLPFNYPVIAGFRNGEAVAIRSIDLTAPIYEDSDEVMSQIDYEIQKLTDFQGSTRKTGIQPETIQASDILSKKLIIVVPGNSDYQMSSEIFSEAKAIAYETGINLYFEVRGNSYRYHENEDIPA